MSGAADMELTVNGKKVEAPDGTTITTLLETLHINPLRVAVQVNQEIIKRERYEKIALKAGDTLEIITLMAGGSE